MTQKKIRKNYLKNNIKPMGKISFFYSDKDDIPAHIKDHFKETTITEKPPLIDAVQYVLDKLPDHLHCFISMEFYLKKTEKPLGEGDRSSDRFVKTVEPVGVEIQS